MDATALICMRPAIRAFAAFRHIGVSSTSARTAIDDGRQHEQAL